MKTDGTNTFVINNIDNSNINVNNENYAIVFKRMTILANAPFSNPYLSAFVNTWIYNKAIFCLLS